LTEKVKNIVNSIFPVSNSSFKEIEKLLVFETFTKGENFITKNKANDKEYFILEGIVKSYVLSPEGEEITISFFMGNSILSPYDIRTKNNLSNLDFKSLSDVKLASINAKDFENLMIKYIDIRNFANTVLQNELIAKVDKEIGLASLTAKERLIEFRKKYKLLENLIPHTDIASYLGITNISLSRLRKELT